MKLVRGQKDFCAGLFFLGVAAVFGAGLTELRIGTAFEMGPGYFPMLLIVLLALLGGVLLVSGLRVAGEPISGLSWRVLASIVLPIVFFGASLNALGFVPALFLAIFATSYASPDRQILVSLLATAFIVGICWVIFLWGLGLPMQPFAPWIGGVLDSLSWK